MIGAIEIIILVINTLLILWLVKKINQLTKNKKG